MQGYSMNTATRWEHYEHEADIGVRGTGPSLAAAFEQAALALTAVVTDPNLVNPSETIAIECSGEDPELLLVSWLNALVYEMSTRNMLFAEYQVAINDGQLTATVRGEKVDRQRHQPAVEVKGATLTTLRVIKENGEWVVQTVVDV